MTRKRFCKILMGRGISRNEANKIAANRPRQMSFREYARSPGIMLYMFQRRALLALKSAFNRFNRELAKIAERWANLVHGIRREEGFHA